MEYIEFDIDSWQRKEHFKLYDADMNCSFSLTTKLDVTNLKGFIRRSNYAFYPTIIYLLSKLVNKYPEFRFSKRNNKLILWDSVEPSFTIFHKETETFSSLWCKYSSDIKLFMDEYNNQMSLFKDDLCLAPQEEQAENVFYISSLPWLIFDSFNLNIADVSNNLAPIFTMGKYFDENNKILLPFAVQVHHSVCDGFHVGRFINELQKLCDEITN